MGVTTTIKRLPDEVYARVRERARRNGRSVNKELIALLEAAVSDERDASDLRSESAALRERVGIATLSEQDLRTLRDEGRP